MHTRREFVACVERNYFKPRTTLSQVCKEMDHEEDVCVRFNPPLGIQRYEFAYDILLKDELRIVRMADFGCAEGRFFRRLKNLPFAEEINLIDILKTEIDEAASHVAPIPWDLICGRFIEMTLNLYQGNVAEPDDRLIGLDALTMIELIEHLDPETLARLPPNIFGYLQPRIVIVSTPNAEYNVHFRQLEEGMFRHWDHKFEWTRQEFETWCITVADEYGYTVSFDGVGEPKKGQENVGHCSQFALFRRKSSTFKRGLLEVQNYNLLHTFNFPKRSKALERSADKMEMLDWDFILKDVRTVGEQQDVKTE